jgi:hypothetical protein
MNLKRYQNARCKVDKTLVVIGIVNSIRKSSPCGGFIKKCTKSGRWISMSDEAAREKVGHCLRDMLASQRENKITKAPLKHPKVASADMTQIKPTAVARERANLHPSSTPFKSSTAKISSPGNKVCSMPPLKAVRAAAKPVASINMNSPPSFAGFVQASGNFSAGNGDYRQLSVRSVPKAPVAVRNDAPQVPRTFSNFNYLSSARGNSQEMSAQQCDILKKIEGGFKGSVEELLEAIQ